MKPHTHTYEEEWKTESIHRGGDSADIEVRYCTQEGCPVREWRNPKKYEFITWRTPGKE